MSAPLTRFSFDTVFDGEGGGPDLGHLIGGMEPLGPRRGGGYAAGGVEDGVEGELAGFRLGHQ